MAFFCTLCDRLNNFYTFSCQSQIIALAIDVINGRGSSNEALPVKVKLMLYCNCEVVNDILPAVNY